MALLVQLGFALGPFVEQFCKVASNLFQRENQFGVSLGQLVVTDIGESCEQLSQFLDVRGKALLIASVRHPVSSYPE
jgi:hypothetical protein